MNDVSLPSYLFDQKSDYEDEKSDIQKEIVLLQSEIDRLKAHSRLSDGQITLLKYKLQKVKNVNEMADRGKNNLDKYWLDMQSALIHFSKMKFILNELIERGSKAKTQNILPILSNQLHIYEFQNSPILDKILGKSHSSNKNSNSSDIIEIKAGVSNIFFNKVLSDKSYSSSAKDNDSLGSNVIESSGNRASQSTYNNETKRALDEIKNRTNDISHSSFSENSTLSSTIFKLELSKLHKENDLIRNGITRFKGSLMVKHFTFCSLKIF